MRTPPASSPTRSCSCELSTLSIRLFSFSFSNHEQRLRLDAVEDEDLDFHFIRRIFEKANFRIFRKLLPGLSTSGLMLVSALVVVFDLFSLVIARLESEEVEDLIRLQ